MLYFCVAVLLIAIILSFSFGSDKIYTGDLKRDCSDSIKGIAIIGIFLSHIVMYSNPEGMIKHLWMLGAYGVSIFFALSGYGNSFSIDRTNNRFLWLFRKIIEIIVPFAFSYLYVILCGLFFAESENINTGLFQSFFTLTIPGTTTWYLKIQILLYVFLFLGIIVSRKHYIIVVTVFSIIYIIIVSQISTQTFWWQTIMCFSCGISWRYFRKNNKTPSNVFGVILYGIFVAITFYIVLKFYGTVIAHCVHYICFAWFILEISYLDLPQNRIIKWIGQRSIVVYLIHIGLCPMLIGKVYNLSLSIALAIILTSLGSIIVGGISKKLTKVVIEKLRLNTK